VGLGSCLLTKTIFLKKRISTYSIEENSTQEFNQLWTRVLGLPPNTDVYASLSMEDLIVLKECISNINGLITQKVTSLFIDWLGEQQLILPKEVETEQHKLAETSAYANGFDIDIAKTATHAHIIAEVKCNIPISPKKFGVMQKKGIIKDLIYMSTPIYKKNKEQDDVTDTYRFMVLLDYQTIDKNVRDAMDDLLSFIRSHQSISISNKTYNLLGSSKSDIIQIEEYQSKKQLNTSTIYIVYIPLIA